MLIKCTDCYEENDVQNQRCSRCGRLLDDAKSKVEGHFEWQHYDAPNTIVRRDKQSGTGKKKVW